MNYKNLLYILPALLLLFPSCKSFQADEAPSAPVTELLDQASASLSRQEYDVAMENVANYVGDILVERSKRIADIGLSKREVEIIRLTADGMTAAQIAEHLYISIHTVNTHRQHIYAKMKVKNLNELLRAASELGIV